MHSYMRICKKCGKVTGTWKISDQYFNFLKRSSGIEFEGDTAFHMMFCDSCAPEAYMSADYKPPEPFKKKPAPLPPNLVIPSKNLTSHLKVPK